MKTVLITGISKGIGRALAQKFLDEGYSVLGTTTSGKGDMTHDNLRTYRLDLSLPQSILECTEALMADGVKLDILINNAAIMADENDTRVVPEKLRQTLEVNLIGTADFTERLIPALADVGHIINISSSAGSLERTSEGTGSHYPYHYPSYKISKCALNMYTRTLALRFKNESRDITVSSVHPGWVRTEMGGEEAPVTPEEAASKIFALAISRPETGKFWFDGQTMPW